MSNLKDRFVNPLTDFGFKRLFGTEPNKDILIEFLNDLLPEKHQVQDLHYLDREQLGHNDGERKAIFDVRCVAESGEHFIVELQKAKQKWFKDRSIYYASFPIQQQAQKGEWHFELAAVYTIGILDFVFDDHTKETDPVHVVELKNQRNEVFYDKLKFIYIELPKFAKTVEELNTDLDKWLYLFRHLPDLENIPEPFNNGVFAKLFSEATLANFTREERQQYEDNLKIYRDLQNTISYAREEGKTEVAVKMKAEGFDAKMIARLTGLAESEIGEL